ncbi:MULTISPECIES: biotin-independent malonate decarboxylase subunit gamma [Marinomonas]|uniref:Biotin-independent malonate decarboxylase subunit gamma n=1 Tax=Marinomonas rhodophyticola TaxID=2992803 RepID=A0ABT3KIU9_9GAMM|nr:biotin-independent malonate decarboxylase subunit gamma [Marinomonas sp. KJ51-3]MCW4630468.1 biotin-independent malonate decarboxylase subunit gamma [Marinomonas sp. KJ51-3]
MSTEAIKTDTVKTHRGRVWFDLLADNMMVHEGAVPSVMIANGNLAERPCSLILVQPDKNNLYPRAINGEVGLLEGWALADAIHNIVSKDAGSEQKSAIIAIVDVPSQAYGRREEALGIHQALAAAVSAYAQARQAGHPVIALLVGKAMSGAFLAHGYQANTILALNDDGVMVHAMGKAAAARITMRSEEELDQLAKAIPPMAYDLKSFATLGLIEQFIDVSSADAPSSKDIELVQTLLADAVDNLKGDTQITKRLQGENRGASRRVRELLRSQWKKAEPSL